MIKEFMKKYEQDIKNCLEDLKNVKTWYRQVPNILTAMRLVLAIPAGLLYYLNPTVSLFSIAFLWLTDAVDGKIARKLNIQSKIGADMDAVADKIMFLGSALPLLSSAPFLIVNFVLEGVISAINVTGRIKGLDTKTVLSGKVKTVSLSITLVLGYLAQFLGIPMAIFRLLIGATTGLQAVAIKDYIVVYKRMNNEQNENLVIDNKDDIIYEDLSNNEQDILLEQLKRERDFILATMEPDKVYTGKKRTRVLLQEKKNNHSF